MCERAPAHVSRRTSSSIGVSARSGSWTTSSMATLLPSAFSPYTRACRILTPRFSATVVGNGACVLLSPARAFLADELSRLRRERILSLTSASSTPLRNRRSPTFRATTFATGFPSLRSSRARVRLPPRSSSTAPLPTPPLLFRTPKTDADEPNSPPRSLVQVQQEGTGEDGVLRADCGSCEGEGQGYCEV